MPLDVLEKQSSSKGSDVVRVSSSQLIAAGDALYAIGDEVNAQK